MPHKPVVVICQNLCMAFLSTKITVNSAKESDNSIEKRKSDKQQTNSYTHLFVFETLATPPPRTQAQNGWVSAARALALPPKRPAPNSRVRGCPRPQAKFQPCMVSTLLPPSCFFFR